MSKSEIFRSTSPEDTLIIGAELSQRLQPGDVVLLAGQLGAGKTMLVRGIARGLGSDSHVSSPTFVLIHEYEGTTPVAHVDLYRLPDGTDIDELGIQEYFTRGYITIVEWPDRASDPCWGDAVWQVTIDVISETDRMLHLTPARGKRE